MLTNEMIGMFQAAATDASLAQLSSGPTKARTRSSRLTISVILRMHSNVPGRPVSPARIIIGAILLMSPVH